jgi:hypothetical protein
MATYEFDSFISDGSLVRILLEDEWKSFTPLSDLISGTDFDGNSAWYWAESHPTSASVLNTMKFQWSIEIGKWNDCVVICGREGTSFFPGNNNIRAKAGFLLPFLSYHSGKLQAIKFRALAPVDLLRLVEK